MMTLCVVPCGKRKIWDVKPNAGPTKMRDVYIGPFAKKCCDYAKKFHPDSWCILSAKYGFLWPEEIIPGPYNVTFNDRKTNPITLETLHSQVNQKNLKSFDRIVVLGGIYYRNIILSVLPDKEYVFPLEGITGLGKMMQALNSMLYGKIEEVLSTELVFDKTLPLGSRRSTITSSCGKYFKLQGFLKQEQSFGVYLTFSKIEDILQNSLPLSARKYKAWWANGVHSQANAWLGVGFRVAEIDLVHERVRFERTK